MVPQNQTQMAGQAKTEEGKEESLNTLLDENQRGELTFLIASAAAAMRKTITSSFDANVTMSYVPYIDTN